MKLSTTLLAALVPFMVYAQPAASPEDDPPPPPATDDADLARRAPAELEARNLVCSITSKYAHYRTCPRSSCPSRGQYHRGEHVNFTCYTKDNTDYIKNYGYWLRDYRGYYVWGGYVDYFCWKKVPRCHY